MLDTDTEAPIHARAPTRARPASTQLLEMVAVWTENGGRRLAKPG